MTRTRPDHDAIMLTYHQEVSRGGKTGALARAAVRLGVSDETVRRARITDEQRPREQELAYTPAPGERPIAPRVAPMWHHKPRHMSPLLHRQLRLRNVAHKEMCHNVSSEIATHIVAGDLLAPHISYSREYLARKEIVNRFATSAPVRVTDLHAREPFNLRLWGAVMVCVVFLLIIFATTHYKPAQARPLKGTFSPEVSSVR